MKLFIKTLEMLYFKIEKFSLGHLFIVKPDESLSLSLSLIIVSFYITYMHHIYTHTLAHKHLG